MIKKIIQKLKHEKISSFFLLFGMTIAFIMISLATNFVHEIVESSNRKDNSKPDNAHNFVIQHDNSTPFSNLDELTKCFSKTAKNTGLYIPDIEIPTGEINTFYEVKAEWFDNDNVWHYPLCKGKYFTKKQIDNHEKVILIGKKFQHLIKKKNDNTEYVTIEGKDYTVCGIIGFKDISTDLDQTICIPITAIPDSYQDYILSCNFSFVMYNKEDKKLESISNLKEEFSKKFDNVQILDNGPLPSDNIARKILYQKTNGIFFISIIGYLSSLVYAINIVAFWIEKRKYEMALKKAVGYSNKQLAYSLYKEMFSISCISCIIGLSIQFILKNILSRYISSSIKINLVNIIISIITILITSLLTSIWPIRKVMKIEPIKMLK